MPPDNENPNSATGVALNAGPAPTTVLKAHKFNFKKPDALTGTKRAPVELELPMPTLQGLVDFLQPTANTPEAIKIAERNQQFVLDLLAAEVKEQARQQVADEDKPVSKQDELDLGKLDITYIANLPPTERRGGGVPKETWEAFGVKYNEIMPAVSNKSAEQVGNASLLLMKRLIPCKTNKVALKTLDEQLNLFWNHIDDESKDEFGDIYAFLGNKIETYLKTDEATLIQNNL